MTRSELVRVMDENLAPEHFVAYAVHLLFTMIVATFNGGILRQFFHPSSDVPSTSSASYIDDVAALVRLGTYTVSSYLDTVIPSMITDAARRAGDAYRDLFELLRAEVNCAFIMAPCNAKSCIEEVEKKARMVRKWAVGLQKYTAKQAKQRELAQQKQPQVPPPQVVVPPPQVQPQQPQQQQQPQQPQQPQQNYARVLRDIFLSFVRLHVPVNRQIINAMMEVGIDITDDKTWSQISPDAFNYARAYLTGVRDTFIHRATAIELELDTTVTAPTAPTAPAAPAPPVAAAAPAAPAAPTGPRLLESSSYDDSDDDDYDSDSSSV